MTEHSQTVNAVLARIQGTVDDLYNTEISEQSVDEMLNVLKTLIQLGDGIDLIKYYVLLWFEENWNNFNLSWRLNYTNQFIIFACKHTGKKWHYIKDQMDTAHLFLIEKQQPESGQVELPVRDKHGNVVTEAKTVQKEKKKWDATTPAISKLRVIKPLVRAGKMTPKLWSMTADPKVTYDDLQYELRVGGERQDVTPSPKMVFRLEGPLLLVERLGIVAELADLAFDLWDDPLVRDGLEHILHYLQVKTDEDAIAKITRKGEIERAYRKEV